MFYSILNPHQPLRVDPLEVEPHLTGQAPCGEFEIHRESSSGVDPVDDHAPLGPGSIHPHVWHEGHQKMLRSLVEEAPSEPHRTSVPHRRQGRPSRP